MPLKTITVPPRIKVLGDNDEIIYDEKTNKPAYITFYTVARRILNHPNFVKSFNAIKAGQAVLEELKKLDQDSDEYQYIRLAEEDWEHFKDAASQPQQLLLDGKVLEGLGWPSNVLFQISHMLKAIIEPTDKKDEETTKEEFKEE